MINELIGWIKQHFTRKFTVPFHIAGGMLCSLIYPSYPGLAAMLFVAFGLFELWQALKEGDTGWLDFLDGLIGLFLGAIILLIVR